MSIAAAELRPAGGRATLPGDDLVGLEDALEQGLPAELVGDAVHADAGRQGRRGRAGEQDHRDLVAGGLLLRDDVERRRGIGALEQVEDACHQNTMKRRPWRMSSAILARETRTTGWPLSFQSGSPGIASSSTWNGTSSRLRLSRNFAMSSPSIRSSVSASSRCTPGPRSTKVTSFSPATTPTPMRMASKARCEVRGSAAITTRTGCSSATGARSVQRHEAVGAVDQVRQHDETTVRHAIAVGERPAALLTAVGAHEYLGAAVGERAHAGIIHRGHAVVDQVEIQLRAPGQGRVGESDRRLQVRMIEPGGEHETEFLLGEIHRRPSVASARRESKA